MAEPNPQPVQEASPQTAPAKGGGGVMGPIVAAIIIVAGIAGIFEFMVKGALETGAKTPEGLSAEQKPGGGGGDSSVTEGVDTSKTPYDLGEPILVNIKGENNMVLSAKVGFILKYTKSNKENVRENLLKKIDEFKPMLVDAARGYLNQISEADLDNEEVHKMYLKRALNRKFGPIRKSVLDDKDLGEGILPSEPVDVIILPSFTAQ